MTEPAVNLVVVNATPTITLTVYMGDTIAMVEVSPAKARALALELTAAAALHGPGFQPTGPEVPPYIVPRFAEVPA